MVSNSARSYLPGHQYNQYFDIFSDVMNIRMNKESFCRHFRVSGGTKEITLKETATILVHYSEVYCDGD